MIKRLLIYSGMMIFIVLSAARPNPAWGYFDSIVVTKEQTIKQKQEEKLRKEAHEWVQNQYSNPIKPVAIEYKEIGEENDNEKECIDTFKRMHETEGNNIISDDELDAEYIGDWTITAYCGCPECCGKWSGGGTASGAPPIAGHTIACNVLPFGTQVMIDGYVYTVEDTGSTPYGDYWVDIYFDTHEEAEAWGVQIKEVYIVE